MQRNGQLKKSRVVKVDSKESWDFFITQATTQGCPVSDKVSYTYIHIHVCMYVCIYVHVCLYIRAAYGF